MVSRHQLERQERGAAAGRALVLEAPAEELELLPVAKLADRAIGERPVAEVLAASRALDLVLPLRAHLGELARGAPLGQRGRLARGCPEIRQWRATAARGRRTRLTAGSGGPCASPRGCGPTSPRPASTRTSPASDPEEPRRRRARQRSRTRRSSQ